MSILTAAELKASREAVQAGVSAVSDSVAEDAIAKAEAKLNLALGYKVANSDTELAHTVTDVDGETILVSERIRSISSVTDAPPGGSGTSITNYRLRGPGFRLYRSGGWIEDNVVTITGTFGYANTDDKYILAKEFVLKLAVRELTGNATGSEGGGFPTPAGAFLTGFSSEQATFSYFTPEGTITGYKDLDEMLNLIGRHPNKTQGLYTVSVGGGARDFTFDDIISGRYEGDIE